MDESESLSLSRAVVCLCLGVFLIWTARVVRTNIEAVLVNGISTTAVITSKFKDVSETLEDKATEWGCVRFSFKDQSGNEQHSHTCNSLKSSLYLDNNIGQTINVKYNPNHPNAAIVIGEEWKQQDFAFTSYYLLMGFGVALLIIPMQWLFAQIGSKRGK